MPKAYKFSVEFPPVNDLGNLAKRLDLRATYTWTAQLIQPVIDKKQVANEQTSNKQQVLS